MTEIGIVPRALFLACCMFGLARCAKTTPHADDYYLIQSYDGVSGHWTIVHFGTWDGQRQRRRYVLECSGYQNEQGETIHGPDVCSLPVGARLPQDWDKFGPIAHPDQKFWWASERRQPLFVSDMTNIGLLTVTEDDKNVGGKQIAANYFRVLKADVEPDK